MARAWAVTAPRPSPTSPFVPTASLAISRPSPPSAPWKLNPTPRLNVYFNYGGDYVYRDYVLSGTTRSATPTRDYGVGGPSLHLHRQRAGMTGCLSRPRRSASAGAGAPIRPLQPIAAAATRTCRSSRRLLVQHLQPAPRDVCARASSTRTDPPRSSGPATAARPTPASAPRASTTCSGPRSATTCRNLSPDQIEWGNSHRGLPHFFAPSV